MLDLSRWDGRCLVVIVVVMGIITNMTENKLLPFIVNLQRYCISRAEGGG